MTGSQPLSAPIGGPGPMTAPALLEPAYLTAAQFGEMLQVSEKSIYRWVRQDPTMPALKIGGTVRFPRERLLVWLRSREQGRPRTRTRVLSRERTLRVTPRVL